MDDEQHRQKSGSVPHHFGNSLARQWAPAMPRELTGGFLTLLYVLRTLASADGRLRYERDGKAITIAQISKAARSDQKDIRTYLEAAVAAGVVAVVDDGHGQGRTRGRAVMYALLLCPAPDWQAAAAKVEMARQVKAEQRAAKAARRAARAAQTSGDSPLTSEGPTSGDSPPRSEEEGSGDSPPTGVGGQSPLDLGGQSPDHPCSTQVLHHEMADVVPQPQGAGGRASETTKIPQQPKKTQGVALCVDCTEPLVRDGLILLCGCTPDAPHTRASPQGPIQGAFLIPLPSGATPGPRSPVKPPQAIPPQVADPYVPERVCDCGRTYRAAAPGPCPDCLDAAARERAARTG
ncbi:hypothetical protein ACFY84_29900 [Streptomyces sp. NPDC012438]|uniref:hypothetical protein n=1 Tax=Streptomyces sp. NPDC012438 TaxID=3364833 RepID=UPI0036EFB643